MVDIVKGAHDAHICAEMKTKTAGALEESNSGNIT